MADTSTIKKSSTTPQNTSPFHSLFLSLTRENNHEYTPYLILLQHSTHLLHRLTAAEPDQPNSQQIYKNAGLLTPKESSVKDTRGDLFVKEAWRECVGRCGGRVIFVSCCDFLDLSMCTRSASRGILVGDDGRDCELGRLFEENGVLVDLYSDPLDWDTCSDEDEDENDDVSMQKKVKQIKGQVNKLQSIVSAIQQAAQYISSQSDTEQSPQKQQQQPIPIIFDSITPILLHHGVEKLTLLLTHLKQSANGTTTTHTVTSPIFIPTLAEILPPSSNRILEDYADAVMTLNGGKLSIARRSARSGGMVSGGFSGGVRLTKDVQYFEIESNGNGAGNELVLLKSNEGNGNNGQDVDGKKKKDDEDVEDIATGASRMNISDGAEQKVSALGDKGKQRPILQHEDDEQTRLGAATKVQPVVNKPTPRIYMDEDDPEFDDLDEEDPDDDLDI